MIAHLFMEKKMFNTSDGAQREAQNKKIPITTRPPQIPNNFMANAGKKGPGQW